MYFSLRSKQTRSGRNVNKPKRYVQHVQVTYIVIVDLHLFRRFKAGLPILFFTVDPQVFRQGPPPPLAMT